MFNQFNLSGFLWCGGYAIDCNLESYDLNIQNLFAVGLTLSELSAVSTDENWNETFIEGETKQIHKVC
jgi:vacuolar protein sorting-associated protein 13A/C